MGTIMIRVKNVIQQSSLGMIFSVSISHILSAKLHTKVNPCVFLCIFACANHPSTYL